MKKFKIITVFLLVCSLLFTSNQSNSASTKNITNTWTDDGINEFGLLKEVEDSGYPLATLHIEIPERKFSEYFTINLEEVKNVNMEILQKWKGKYVSFV